MGDTKPVVDQSRATARGDNIAGNKTSIGVLNQTNRPVRAGTLERLMEKLSDEMRDDKTTRDQIDTLQLYYKRRSHDGIDGLEAKLKHAGRDAEIMDAFEKKELFVKLLNRFSLYASAQEIFAYILARAERRYKTTVLPVVGDMEIADIDNLISTAIVEPLVEEVGAGVFSVNDAIVLGMIYWLAEQCFVRWHA